MFDFIGKKLGAYDIGEPIGQGGMATVYKAFQASMNRAVAVKILPPLLAQNAVFLARFRQEAQVIARLEHAHILPVYDYGESDGVVYIVMRYLDGGSLEKRIGAGHMPLRDVRKYLEQMSAALDYAHQQGVIHRDIKPSNVLIDRQGDAFLTDFGIAKMMAGTLSLTGTGVIGTPQYMSPEQGQGLDVGAPSDVYSLGVVLYEMLAGRLPFEADTPLGIVVKHVTAPLPTVRTFAPDLPEPIEEVMSRALAKHPDDRFASAGELAAVFEEVIRAGLNPATKPVRAAVPPTEQSLSVRPTVQPRRPVRIPRPIGLGALAVIGIAVVSGAIAMLVRGDRPPPDSDAPSADIVAGPSIITPTPDRPTITPGALTLTPAAGVGCEPIVFDDFSDPAGGFPRGENDSAAWGYRDGEYRLLIKSANVFEARTLRRDFDDYAVEVDAYFAADTPGDYGLVLDADAATTRHYTFAVDNAQNFAVTRREPGGSVVIRDWTFAPSLYTGSTVNRLRAVHKDGTLALYGNGILLAVITDTLDLSPGASRIGLVAASFGSSGVEARFDNFRVCPAPESIAPTDVSLVDAFDDDRNRWAAVRYAGGLSAFIEDGQFQLSVPDQEPRLALFHWNRTFAVGDFELEVDSRVLEGAPGSRAGLMFGIQDLANSYILYASTDGLLSFYRRIEGDQPSIVLDQPSPAIRPGDAANHWSVRVSNGLLTVRLNDEQVLQASIAYTSGAIGFACEPGGPPLARCAFDNLSVHGQPSTGEVIAYPFCNCQVGARAGQPVLAVWVWKVTQLELADQFLSSIDMQVSIDGRPLADPMQYWGAVDTTEDDVQTRWAYPLPVLDPGSHIVEVSVSTAVELTDGRDDNADGRPDTFGPGEIYSGYVQIVVSP